MTANFEAAHGGSGSIHVESFIELHDPDEKIPFLSAVSAYGHQSKGIRSANPIAGLREPRRRRSRNDFRVSISTIEDVLVFDRHHMACSTIPVSPSASPRRPG
jgi:hypothetical protein